MNMYLYTDIDIFKNKTSAFFFVFKMKKERGIKKKRLWETFGELFRRTWEAAGAPKLGMGAKVRLKTALKTTSLFDYWQLCNGNGPSNQWTRVTERRVLRWKTNFKWLQLPPSPFLSVSFFLQPCLCFCSLTDSLQIFGRDGQRCLLHFSEFTSLPVSFPYTCLGLTSEALQWNGASPPLLIALSIEEKWITGGGDGLLRRQLHLKKKKKKKA